MTQPSDVGRAYKREILLRAVADAAWAISPSLPFELDKAIEDNVVTLGELVDWFRIELSKTV